MHCNYRVIALKELLILGYSKHGEGIRDGSGFGVDGERTHLWLGLEIIEKDVKKKLRRAGGGMNGSSFTPKEATPPGWRIVDFNK